MGLPFRSFSTSCSGSEAGSYLRLIDSCIPQLKAQGPSRACNESKEEEEDPATNHHHSEREQIVFFHCLDLNHKPPDSGERQYKSRPGKKRICLRSEGWWKRRVRCVHVERSSVSLDRSSE